MRHLVVAPRVKCGERRGGTTRRQNREVVRHARCSRGVGRLTKAVFCRHYPLGRDEHHAAPNLGPGHRVFREAVNGPVVNRSTNCSQMLTLLIIKAETAKKEHPSKRSKGEWRMSHAGENIIRSTIIQRLPTGFVFDSTLSRASLFEVAAPTT